MADEAEADEAEANEAGPGMPVLGEAADDNGREVAGLGALVDEQESAAATEVVADEVKQELVEGAEREAAGCWRESGVAFQDDFTGRA